VTRLAVGSYTAVSGGHGAGVTVLELDVARGTASVVQVLEADDPSFLVVADGALHAVAETTEGRVLSWTAGPGTAPPDATWTPGATAASGGASPCHVAHDPASGALVVSAYVGGTVGVLPTGPVTADAPPRVTRTLALPAGSGPVHDRQGAPHAHQAVPTPWGTLLVGDLGTDRLHEVRVDPATLEPTLVASHELPAGSGPRHVDLLVGGGAGGAGGAGGDVRVVVAGELDGRVHVLRREGAALVLDHSVPVFEGGGTPPDVLLSHLEVHGGRVYVATRGRDTVSVLEPRGDDGRLGLTAEVPCGGAWPRHFAIVDGHLVCANQESGTVTWAPLDPRTGVPGDVTGSIALGSPACVVVLPPA